MKTFNLLKIVLFIGSFWIATTTLLGQNNTPINLSNDWEVWYDKVPVSGEIRVGIMVVNTDESISPSSFYVILPTHEEKYLFCEISSRDGRYEASLTYDISKLKIGCHKFEFPTQHKEELKQYSANDITILTSIGNNPDSDTSYFTSASWVFVNSIPENIVILLNSERRTTIVVEDRKTKTNQEFSCEKIQAEASISYNSKCIIPSKVIDANSDVFIKQRVRRMNKITYNSYPITFKLPSNEAW